MHRKTVHCLFILIIAAAFTATAAAQANTARLPAETDPDQTGAALDAGVYYALYGHAGASTDPCGEGDPAVLGLGFAVDVAPLANRDYFLHAGISMYRHYILEAGVGYYVMPRLRIIAGAAQMETSGCDEGGWSIAGGSDESAALFLSAGTGRGGLYAGADLYFSLKSFTYTHVGGDTEERNPIVFAVRVGWSW